MDGFSAVVRIPIVVGIGETAVIDQACCSLHAADIRFRSARQSVRLHSATERIPAGEVVVKREELALLRSRK